MGTAPSGARAGAPLPCLNNEAGVRGAAAAAAAAAARRPQQSASSARTALNGGAEARERPPVLLLEHVFFRGLPGWGGPGTGGAWEDGKLEGSVVAVPDLCDALDVRHFDSRFTSQAVELSLQGHPHKGGPTPAFEDFEWREDSCIEYAQVAERSTPGLFESLASALWC
ncbi:unnamed protein product [Ectocarpus fasciculatus]